MSFFFPRLNGIQLYFKKGVRVYWEISWVFLHESSCNLIILLNQFVWTRHRSIAGEEGDEVLCSANFIFFCFVSLAA